MDKVYIVKYHTSGDRPENVIIDESRFYKSFKRAFEAIVEDYMQTIRNFPELDMEVDEAHGRARLYDKSGLIERAWVSTIEVVE